MKITMITACCNAVRTLGDALESVGRQRLCRAAGDGRPIALEYIVVDGGSTDGTVEKLRAFEARVRTLRPSDPSFSFRWVSERDKGLYDALNKGIRMATGDVVGICNADDALAADDTLLCLAEAFEGEEGGRRIDATYADVRFVANPPTADGDAPPEIRLAALRASKTTRYCTGRFFRRWMFRFATFPAHPSTFVRREWFARAGWYSLDFGMFADFEFMLRLFWKHGIRAKYVSVCTHVMRSGGASTGSFRKNMLINATDLRALRANGYWSCLPMMYLKYPFKAVGLLFRGLLEPRNRDRRRTRP